MSLEQMLADPEQGWLDDVVDLERYPISDRGKAGSELIEAVRSDLGESGAASLPGFLRPEALASIAAQISEAATHVAIRRHEGTVYARDDLEAELDPGDPRRVTMGWNAGHVTRDMIPPYSAAARLYASPVFKEFVAATVGQSKVYEYADPLAGLVATILPPEGQYPWHYDTNEFVVTLMIRKPDGGGLFEYSKDLRAPGRENLEGLSAVLDGSDRTSIRVADCENGELQLFCGRYSLHRVSTVEGVNPRHVLVLSYAGQPGLIGPLDRTRRVYGRVTEAHIVAAEVSRLGTDGLIL